MKNIRSLFRSLTVVFAFGLLNQDLRAQSCISCPYTIINNLSCEIDVDWEMVRGSCPAICVGANVTIPPNSFITISGACCTGAVDVNVYVKPIRNATYPGGGWVDQTQAVMGPCHCNGPHTNDGGSCESDCGGSFQIDWTSSSTIIY